MKNNFKKLTLAVLTLCAFTQPLEVKPIDWDLFKPALFSTGCCLSLYASDYYYKNNHLYASYFKAGMLRFGAGCLGYLGASSSRDQSIVMKMIMIGLTAFGVFDAYYFAYWRDLAKNFIIDCQNGNYDKVAKMLSAHDWLANYGASFGLREAARRDKDDIVGLLLAQGHADIAAVSYEAVWHALKNNNRRMIKIMFDHIKKVSRDTNNDLFAALENAIKQNWLDGVSEAEQDRILVYLSMGESYSGPIEKCTSLEDCRNMLIKGSVFDDPGHIFFGYAALRSMFENYSVNDRRLFEANSLLHLAARCNSPRAVKALLKIGFDSNQMYSGQTPLQLAQEMGHTKVTEELLKYARTDLRAPGMEDRRVLVRQLTGQSTDGTTLPEDVAKQIVSFLPYKNNKK